MNQHGNSVIFILSTRLDSKRQRQMIIIDIEMATTTIHSKCIITRNISMIVRHGNGEATRDPHPLMTKTVTLINMHICIYHLKKISKEVRWEMIIIIGNDFQLLSVWGLGKSGEKLYWRFWLRCVINYKVIVKVINYFGEIFPKMITRVCNKCDTNLVSAWKVKESVSFFELWLWWDVW